MDSSNARRRYYTQTAGVPGRSSERGQLATGLLAMRSASDAIAKMPAWTKQTRFTLLAERLPHALRSASHVQSQ